MRKHRPITALGALAAVCLVQPACLGGDEFARGRVAVVGDMPQALMSGELVAVDGSYGAACASRFPGSWSVGVDGEMAVGAELSVIVNNAACVLTLTALRTSLGPIMAVDAIELATDYNGMASAFSSPVDFYANAKLTPADFSDDFALIVLFSQSTVTSLSKIAQPIPPTVVAVLPPNASTGRSIATKPSATFDSPMDDATLTGLTFTLTQGGAPIAGAVSFDVGSNTATFSPTALLGLQLPYVATITTGAKDIGNTGLTANYVWTFTTAEFSEGPVELGTAAGFSALANATVTNTGMTTLAGKVGGMLVTGFPPGTASELPHIADGEVAAGHTDLIAAYDDAAGRTLLVPNLVPEDIGGQTKTPGLYTAASSLQITGDVTLDALGDSAAVFIFQIASTLTMAPASRVLLTGGALAANIYWQVGSSATLQTGSSFYGTILAAQSITLNAGATVVGRLLARDASVTLDANVVVAP